MDKPPNGDALPKIPGTTERNRFLTDGRNVILVMIFERSFLFEITRFGDNDQTRSCGLSTENSKPGSLMRITPITARV